MEKLTCCDCGEEIEHRGKVYRIDNDLYCANCLKPIEGIVGYNLTNVGDSYDSWVDVDEVECANV